MNALLPRPPGMPRYQGPTPTFAAAQPRNALAGIQRSFAAGEKQAHGQIARADEKAIGNALATRGYGAAGNEAATRGRLDTAHTMKRTAIDLQQMDEKKKLKLMEFMVSAARKADTPQKWATYVQMAGDVFGPDKVAKYADFSMRPAALSEADRLDIQLKRARIAQTKRGSRSNTYSEPYTLEDGTVVQKDGNGRIQVISRPRAPSATKLSPYEQQMQRDQAKEEIKQAALGRGGQKVIRMIDQLEGKVSEPGFEDAVGPLADTRLGRTTKEMLAPVADRFGAGYADDLARLERIKQDMQAINSTMERALLQGQGQITEAERESIGRIQGAISQARSVEEAEQLLNNYRSIVRTIFDMPQGGPQPNVARIPPPQQRQVGQVYNTPRGPARWQGNGWEPVE